MSRQNEIYRYNILKLCYYSVLFWIMDLKEIGWDGMDWIDLA
jgi:hypothetical protein